MLITHNGVAMNTRAIALIIVFTALAIALNPIAIPAVFLGGWSFHFWEIPIIVAFLMFGLRTGITVALLRTLAALTLFPTPAGFVAPPITLLATIILMLGLHVANNLLNRKNSKIENLGTRPIAYFTILGTLTRIAFAPFLTYILYRFLLPMVGINVPEPAIIALIPLVVLFDLISSLYTIPVSYLLARMISRNLKVGNPL